MARPNPHYQHHRHNHQGGRGGGYTNHSKLSEWIHCSHCYIAQAPSRFPKSVLTRFQKKVDAGGDPAKINLICRSCCDIPTQATSSARPASADGPSQPHSRAPATRAPSPASQRRACCADCRIEYPLTKDFFLRHELQLKAPRRVCFICKKAQVLFSAEQNTDKDRVAEERFALEEQEEIHLDSSDEDGDDERYTPTRRFEDQDDAFKAQAKRALEDYPKLLTLRGFAQQMAARRRLSIRFVPSRVLLRQQRQQRIREDKIRHNRMVEEHARAARHFALHEVHALGALRLPCSLLDKAVLSKVDDGDLPDDDCKDRELQRYDPNPSRIHVQDIEVNQQYRQSHHDDNDSDDDVDVVPSWYLSDRQRFELIERQRDLEHDLELGHAAASRDAFSPRDLKPIIDADLVQRFEQDLSVARISAPYRAPSEAHDAGTTYRMACMLRALDEESRRIEETKRTEKQDQNPFKKRRGANT